MANGATVCVDGMNRARATQPGGDAPGCVAGRGRSRVAGTARTAEAAEDVMAASEIDRPATRSDDVLRGRHTIDTLLRAAAAAQPHHACLVYGDETLTLEGLDGAVDRLARGLAAHGVRAGDRVPLMMDNHPRHVLAFFALLRLGAVQVPVNTRLRGDSLRYLLGHCEPAFVIADATHAAALVPAVPVACRGRVIWSGDAGTARDAGDMDFAECLAGVHGAEPACAATTPDDVVAILYTSGTTGPPKGVQVTDRMLRTAAEACARVSAAGPGAVYYLWEPLYHIGGSQLLVMALAYPVRLWMSERFSVSRFWEEVRGCGATRIHYLGGMLQLLLRQPATSLDRDLRVAIAYGGGAPAGPWREFERRFGVQIRESYGMTECSSFTSINTEGRFGSVGRPAPWFEVCVVDADARPLPAGMVGEIVVRGSEAGVITPGYFRDVSASARSLRDGWMHSGDLGRFDEDGFLYYAGRTRDCIRRRGENISCWEIERAVESMAEVAESAAVGVPDELGDEAVKLYVRAAEGHDIDPAEVYRWCVERLADFQLPEYIEVVAGFDKTGTERIRKETLSRLPGNAWRRPVRR